MNTKCFPFLKVSFTCSSPEAQVDIWHLLLWMWCISGLHGLCLSCPMVQKARSLDHNVLRHNELLVQCIPAVKSNRAYEQPEARLPGCYAAHPLSAGAKHVLGKQLQEYSATASQYAHLALNTVLSEPQDTSNYDRC